MDYELLLEQTGAAYHASVNSLSQQDAAKYLAQYVAGAGGPHEAWFIPQQRGAPLRISLKYWDDRDEFFGMSRKVSVIFDHVEQLVEHLQHPCKVRQLKCEVGAVREGVHGLDIKRLQ